MYVHRIYEMWRIKYVQAILTSEGKESTNRERIKPARRRVPLAPLIKISRIIQRSTYYIQRYQQFEYVDDDKYAINYLCEPPSDSRNMNRAYNMSVMPVVICHQ